MNTNKATNWASCEGWVRGTASVYVDSIYMGLDLGHPCARGSIERPSLAVCNEARSGPSMCSREHRTALNRLREGATLPVRGEYRDWGELLCLSRARSRAGAGCSQGKSGNFSGNSGHKELTYGGNVNILIYVTWRSTKLHIYCKIKFKSENMTSSQARSQNLCIAYIKKAEGPLMGFRLPQMGQGIPCFIPREFLGHFTHKAESPDWTLSHLDHCSPR